MSDNPMVSEAELSLWMQRYGSQLAGVCTALLRDAHLAQDVVQETFIRAYQNREKFRGQHSCSEKAWLTRIAVNLCRDQQRSKWFRFVDRHVTVEELPLPAPQADDEAKQLFAAVLSLPEKYREVIVLHYYQDIPAGELAQTLHIAKASVYRRLNKAQLLLKAELERGDFHE